MGNKSYPQFSLNTIQLPIPSVTMTKAEYQDAFGINLVNLDLKKVVLLVDGDGRKYYVDEVKEDDDGVHIFAGGNVLNIASNVTLELNAYSVENAKPLYVHPIATTKTGDGIKYTLTSLIFNNSSGEFTLSTFKTFIDDLFLEVGDTVRIMVSGHWLSADGNTKIISASYLFKSSISYGIQGGNINGEPISITGTFDDLFGTPSLFVDGVNKIN